MNFPRIERSIIILVLGFFIVLVSFAIRYSYGILLPEMLLSLNISKLEAGIIYTSHFLGYTIFSLILGVLIDRYNARKIISIFLLIAGIGILLLSLSNTLLEATISYMLTGIGCAAAWVPIVVVIQRWFSKKRAFSVAVTAAGAHSTFALSGIIMPLLVRIGSWRLGWQTLGLASLILVPLTWFLLKSYPEGYEQKKIVRGWNQYKFSLLNMAKDIKLWMLGLSYMFVGFYVAILLAFLSTYCFLELLLPYENAAAVVSMITIGAVPGVIILSFFSEIIGRIKAMIIDGSFPILGLLGIILASNFLNLAFITVSLSAIIYGIGFGALGTLYAAYASDIFSEEYIGAVQGLLIVFFGIGCMISPPLAGWMADITKTFKLSFLTALIASFLSVLLLLPTRKYQKENN